MVKVRSAQLTASPQKQHDASTAVSEALLKSLDARMKDRN